MKISIQTGTDFQNQNICICFLGRIKLVTGFSILIMRGRGTGTETIPV